MDQNGAQWGIFDLPGVGGVFLGEFDHTIDDKGRLTMPAKYRDPLRAGVVVTRGIDRCLTVYTRAAFESVAQGIADFPFTDPNNRDFFRLMFANSADVYPDGQGRILVPPRLRTYANLGTEAVIVGLHDKFEIWNPDDWAAKEDNIEANPQSFVDKLQTAVGRAGS